MSRDLSYETDSGPKTETVSDPNFQVTPTTAAATRRQLSHLARALDHHAQGPNIPFEVNPSLRCFGEGTGLTSKFAAMASATSIDRSEGLTPNGIFGPWA